MFIPSRPHLWLAFGVLLLGIVASRLTLTPPPAELRILSSSPDARLAPGRTDAALIVDIFDTRGIGQAELEFTEGALPPHLLLRLHLQGLESLEFAYAQTTVALSVPSTMPDALYESRLTADADAPTPITATAPCWMAVQRVAPPGQEATIPLHAGYFEVAAPSDFLHSATRRFTLRWIDFYR